MHPRFRSVDVCVQVSRGVHCRLCAVPCSCVTLILTCDGHRQSMTGREDCRREPATIKSSWLQECCDACVRTPVVCCRVVVA